MCNKCNTVKNVNEFSNDCKNSDGLKSICKNCSINYFYNIGSTFEGFIKLLFRDLISNAKKRDILVQITIDDIKSQYNNQIGLCTMTRLKMTWIKHPNESETHINNKFNISVDRIESNKGYTKDNIQLVCATVNIIKNKLPLDKFIEICKKISKNKNLIN